MDNMILNRRLLASALATISIVALSQNTGIPAEVPPYEFRVLRNGVINDTVAGAIHPSGIATTRSGKWVLSFGDRGDAGPGNKTYFVESWDAGQTWSQPYKIIEPDTERQGGGYVMFNQVLDDGGILGARLIIEHMDTRQLNPANLRTSKIIMLVSRDEGRTFNPLQELKSPGQAIISCMSSLVNLKNSDLILSAYCYPTVARQPGAVYGSGFYRSRDGGKTWGEFELAFKEVPATKALGFNESTFAVKEDGSIVGFARIDSRPPTNNMWKVTSTDNGKTWSMPQETDIRGNFPEIKRLNNGLYVMVCGLCIPGDRPTVIFISADGENYERAGAVYYSRPEYNGGRPWGSGSGGTQAIIPVGENRAYVVFYGNDLGLKPYSYIDGCLIEVQLRTPLTGGAAEARAGQNADSSRPAQTLTLPGGVGLDFLYVASGKSTNAMPSPPLVARCGFFLGKHEITQAQYQSVMKTNPACFKGDNLPVENVSWHDALAFCEALTQIEHHAGRLPENELYRLPSEAEWEFAARGGNKSRNAEFSGCSDRKWPDEFTAWYCGNSDRQTHEVGQRGANELGFHDMSGNVWEWTDDCYSDTCAYAGQGQYAREKAIRGGSWNSLGAFCKVTSRSNVAPVRRMNCLGFRVLRTVSKQ